jgi:dissimilatory sulfite reductase (desulfoviridin) alpha/beta subunit
MAKIPGEYTINIKVDRGEVDEALDIVDDIVRHWMVLIDRRLDRLEKLINRFKEDPDGNQT